MQTNWEIKKQGNFEQKTNGNLLTGFQYELPQRTNLLMKKEVKLYTVINYIAEVGGYYEAVLRSLGDLNLKETPFKKKVIFKKKPFRKRNIFSF